MRELRYVFLVGTLYTVFIVYGRLLYDYGLRRLLRGHLYGRNRRLHRLSGLTGIILPAVIVRRFRYRHSVVIRLIVRTTVKNSARLITAESILIRFFVISGKARRYYGNFHFVAYVGVYAGAEDNVSRRVHHASDELGGVLYLAESQIVASDDVQYNAAGAFDSSRQSRD